MSKKLFKSLFVIFIFAAIFGAANFALAASVNLGMQFGEAIGLSSTDPRIIASRIIQIILGFLGIIAVGLIIYAGFLWMTAAGDEDKIDRAKKTLVSAVIGLIIILSAFAIATFVLNRLLEATGGLTETPGAPSGAGINGAGVIGSCSVESVYPAPDQKAVARNAAIMITFKEEVDPATICASPDAAGKCNNSNILTRNISIYKTKDGRNNYLANVRVANSDRKTFIFKPAEYLGSATENSWYTARLGEGIIKLGGVESIFSGCRGGFMEWQFEVSDILDLTPPKVKSGGVFPPPDNGRDDVSASVPSQASGSVAVNGSPQVYAAAAAGAVTAGGGSPAAEVKPNSDYDRGGTFQIITEDGIKASLSTDSGATLLGAADFSGRTVDFPDKLSLTAEGDIKPGNSWTFTVVAAKPAQTLDVGSMKYVFVKENNAAAPNLIVVNSDRNIMAANIAAAINKQADVGATADNNRVTVKARRAGQDGNNIIIGSASPVLAITAMAGGADGGSTAKINDKKDQPRNAAIQINFDEAIMPANVTGPADLVSNVIRVVNAKANPVAENGVCGGDADCRSFSCVNGRCAGGNNYLKGKFIVANQYQTIEFISDNQCGVNGCGEPIYCLPENGQLRVEIRAASLAHCDPVSGTDNSSLDCASDNINGRAYNQCINNICSDNRGGNYADPTPANPKYNIPAFPATPEVRRFPLADIQALDGVTDAAFNSLDGDRNGFADGPATWYRDNPPVYSNNKSCQTAFETIINAAMAARAKQDKVLGYITGAPGVPDNPPFWSTGRCETRGPAGCESLMNSEMKNIGLSGAVKDDLGNLFIFDENENEPTWGPCICDTIGSGGCGRVFFPCYYCAANGDNFSWSFFVNDKMDATPPKIESTAPVRNQKSSVSADLKITFSKLMMLSSLVTGTTKGQGENAPAHKNINIWSLNDRPVGYWLESEAVLDAGGVPIKTESIIKHGDFGEATSYRVQAGSGVRDIYQNCFKPSADIGACSGANENNPSCCNGVTTAELGPDGNCP